MPRVDHWLGVMGQQDQLRSSGPHTSAASLTAEEMGPEDGQAGTQPGPVEGGLLTEDPECRCRPLRGTSCRGAPLARTPRAPCLLPLCPTFPMLAASKKVQRVSLNLRSPGLALGREGLDAQV
jgi:hypothetical protein